jgi:hypothetical protein
MGRRPGNVLLKAKATGLPKDSVANVSQIVALDRGVLGTRAGPSIARYGSCIALRTCSRRASSPPRR